MFQQTNPKPQTDCPIFETTFILRMSKHSGVIVFVLFLSKHVLIIILGSIAVSVDGPSGKTDVKREEKGDKIICSYMPMSPGAYSIAIKYKGKDIKGSPFNAKVSG